MVVNDEGKSMIRLANIHDSEQLFTLNEQFNGKDETSLNEIKQSLYCYL